MPYKGEIIINDTINEDVYVELHSAIFNNEKHEYFLFS
jgi:hypothetical protein